MCNGYGQFGHACNCPVSVLKTERHQKEPVGRLASPVQPLVAMPFGGLICRTGWHACVPSKHVCPCVLLSYTTTVVGWPQGHRVTLPPAPGQRCMDDPGLAECTSLGCLTADCVLLLVESTTSHMWRRRNLEEARCMLKPPSRTYDICEESFAPQNLRKTFFTNTTRRRLARASWRRSNEAGYATTSCRASLSGEPWRWCQKKPWNAAPGLPSCHTHASVSQRASSLKARLKVPGCSLGLSLQHWASMVLQLLAEAYVAAMERRNQV